MPEDRVPPESDQQNILHDEKQPAPNAAAEAATKAEVASSKRHWFRRFRTPMPEQFLPGFVRSRLGKAARLVALGLFFIILIVLGSGGWLVAKHFNLVGVTRPVQRFQATVVPFGVAGTNPADGDTGVTDGTAITIDFNRAVVPASLDGDFFISPQVSGTFTQGANDHEVIFKPVKPFGDGVIVKAMIHGEFQSKDGARLGADYSFSFTMAPADNSVTFTDGYFQYQVDAAPVGTPRTYTLHVGHSVDPNGTLTVYKADMSKLLKSIVYTTSTDENGYASDEYADPSLDTAGMTSVQTMSGLKDSSTLTINKAAGVYVAVAKSRGHDVGHFWLVVNSFGVVAREDDQQTIVYAHSFTDNSSPTITLTAYNLHDSVQTLSQETIDGKGSVPAPFGPKVDAYVAQMADGQQAFIPMAGYLSMADVRVAADLSKTNTIYGLTDRPTYAVGDTMRYSAFVRADNDAIYQLPVASTQLQLYVAQDRFSKRLASLTATVNADGMINGSLPVSSSLAASSGPNQLQLFAVATGGGTDQPIASFTVVNKPTSGGRIIVTFAKSDYLAKDAIAATVRGLDANGLPAANKKVSATIYARDYYEDNAQANEASLGDIGSAIDDTGPMILNLDAHGQVTVPIDVSKLPAGTSQAVTIQASYLDNGAVAGGATAIIHEANGVISFGSGRDVIAPGGTIQGRIYAKDLKGAASAGIPLSYKLVASTSHDGSEPTNKQVASGNLTTDANGYAQMSFAVNKSYTPATTFALTVTGADSSNEAFTGTTYFYVRDPNSGTAFSDVTLAGLDVFGAPSDVTVGQTLHLTVNAPRAIDALVTVERGRIYKSEVVHLKPGDNSYSVDVTSQLVPSFNLVFSYISGGSYQVDGTSYNVSPGAKIARLALTTDKPSYHASDTAVITAQSNDSTGRPLQTKVILGVVSASVYDLNSQVTPDIATFLYGARETTTNGSSSLTIMGSGGGKCGGGGFDQPSLNNPTGSVLLWSPDVVTTSSGSLVTKLKLPKGTWRIYAYTMSGDTAVGSAALTVNAE